MYLFLYDFIILFDGQKREIWSIAKEKFYAFDMSLYSIFSIDIKYIT